MELLTTQIGKLPLGIWISVIILGLTQGSNLIFQWISTFNWRLALKLGVQEHAPDDPDPVNRTHMVMEWGHALADIVSFTVMAPLTIFLTIKGNQWGFILSTFFYLWIFYIGILASTQRLGLVKFGLKNSFKEYMKPLMALWIVFVIPSLIGAISLWSNKEYFVS